jgi:membrane protease YdiL (CAAX protease family)
MWLRRRSIIAAAVCHALFNLGQVAAGFAAGNTGTP